MRLSDVFTRILGLPSPISDSSEEDSFAAMKDTNRQLDDVRRELTDIDARVLSVETSLRARGMLPNNDT